MFLSLSNLELLNLFTKVLLVCSVINGSILLIPISVVFSTAISNLEGLIIENAKWISGDLLFGHNPPDQNEGSGIQQSQRARIHHGYQLIGHLGIALFRRRLIDGWHAEVDSRKMSANLLADLDFEDDSDSELE